MVTEADVWQALGGVTDPEYPLSIVDLGMVYGVQARNGHVDIEMTFTAIGCPAIEMIVSDVKEAIYKLSGVERVHVEIVWSPPWTKAKISETGRTILQYHGVTC